MDFNAKAKKQGFWKSAWWRVVALAIIYAQFAVFLILMFSMSANYQTIYSSPKVEKGYVDFAGMDLVPRDVSSILSGEWEFFYNEWIVTDEAENPVPTGFISVPGHWTGKDFGDGKLPKTGYASYRLRVDNVQPDIDIVAYRNCFMGAYRVFMNGQLVAVSGTVSKVTSETMATGSVDFMNPYRTDGGGIELVIEVSANSTGGLNAAPWLGYSGKGSLYGTNLRYYAMACFGVATAVVAVSFLNYFFFKYKRDISVPLLLSALYVHFFCSKDVSASLGFPYGVALVFGYISLIAAYAALVYHLVRAGVNIKKEYLLAGVGVATAAIIAFFCLLPTDFGLIPTLILAVLALTVCAPVLGCRRMKVPLRIIYALFILVITSICTLEICDIIGAIVYGTEFFLSFIMLGIIALFSALGLWRIAMTSRTAMRASELERELFTVRQKALKAQIKPHFVFNSLTAIQAQYREGVEAGDKAMEKFARHLRLNIDSEGDGLIPFDDEVKNILNYFELENLRAGGGLNLLLDLNFTDFFVPVLSLQPLVENAP